MTRNKRYSYNTSDRAGAAAIGCAVIVWFFYAVVVIAFWVVVIWALIQGVNHLTSEDNALGVLTEALA